MKQPDTKAHFYISLVKSAIRIIAGLVLMCGMIHATGLLIIVAEVVGILEEIV